MMANWKAVGHDNTFYKYELNIELMTVVMDLLDRGELFGMTAFH